MRDYVTVETGKTTQGVRATIVRGVPSPWGEALKGILHVKGIDWQPVSFDPMDATVRDWTGSASAPVLMAESQAPIDTARAIVEWAEAFAPDPALLPEDQDGRDQVLNWGDTLLGNGGLAWMRRLQLVHLGMTGAGGFSGGVAAYLAGKYGYDAAAAEENQSAVIDGLGAFTAQLEQAEGPYLTGSNLTAADIQLACVMALFAPLPEAQCAMHPKARATFETLDDATRAALSPALLAHRDHVYATHLELPLSL